MAGDILPSLERITNKIVAIQIALKKRPIKIMVKLHQFTALVIVSFADFSPMLINDN